MAELASHDIYKVGDLELVALSTKVEGWGACSFPQNLFGSFPTSSRCPSPLSALRCPVEW